MVGFVWGGRDQGVGGVNGCTLGPMGRRGIGEIHVTDDIVGGQDDPSMPFCRLTAIEPSSWVAVTTQRRRSSPTAGRW